jgi:PKHD-type hydroxylase
LIHPFDFTPKMISPIDRGHRHIDWVTSSDRLSENACDTLVALGRSFPISPPTVVGEDQLSNHRVGEVHKVPRNAEARPLYELLWAVAQDATKRHYALHLTAIAREPHYVEYSADRGHFHWHDDYSHESEIAPRKLTVVIQLSDGADYDGGDFEVFGPPNAAKTPRDRGSILCLPSFVPHRVVPVTRGTRRVIVAWIAGPRIV